MDSDLVASLFPRVVDLTQLAIANSAHALESEQKQQKLAQNAVQLRTAFETLTAQAAALPAGDLTLDDQTWLIQQLTAELAQRKQELADLNEFIPTALDNDAKMND